MLIISPHLPSSVHYNEMLSSYDFRVSWRKYLSHSAFCARGLKIIERWLVRYSREVILTIFAPFRRPSTPCSRHALTLWNIKALQGTEEDICPRNKQDRQDLSPENLTTFLTLALQITSSLQFYQRHRGTNMQCSVKGQEKIRPILNRDDEVEIHIN